MEEKLSFGIVDEFVHVEPPSEIRIALKAAAAP
jgi:hypothetical protein